jgi:flagellar hook-basal body complex protein FliE
MIQFNPGVGPISGPGLKPTTGIEQAGTGPNPEFGKMVEKFIGNVDGQQQASDNSIKDLLSGKSQDINAVVAEVAKADMSFKLLVGVRNKVIEAYKQTMQMQI